MRARADRDRIWEDLRRKRLIAPSLLSADFSRLAESIRSVEGAGAEVLHLDVMDGHFVPNITFGPPVVSSVSRATALCLDAHLMITDPLFFLEPFARAGADSITVHVEALPDLEPLRRGADGMGIRLGLAIRPDTPLEATLESSGEVFDLILVMTVMPGFGGQSYMPGSTERIAVAEAFCLSSARRPVLEVDGGIGPGTAAEAVRAGAGWLVAGSAVFGGDAPGAAFRALSEEIASGDPFP